MAFDKIKIKITGYGNKAVLGKAFNRNGNKTKAVSMNKANGKIRKGNNA
jgi:hypothetical protein